MKLLHYLNMFLAILLEIILFVGAGVFGYHWVEGSALKYVLAIGLPALIVTLWGLFAAPKSRHRLTVPARTVFKLILFAGFVFALYNSGHALWAILYAAASIFCLIIEYAEEKRYA